MIWMDHSLWKYSVCNSISVKIEEINDLNFFLLIYDLN